MASFPADFDASRGFGPGPRPSRAGGGHDRSDATGRDVRPIGRPLACIAAFYDSEPAQRAAAETLRRQFGLKASHLIELAPCHAEPGQFARQAQRWSGRWSSSAQAGWLAPDVMAWLVMLLLLSLCLVAWAFEADLSAPWWLAGLVLFGVVAALLGSALDLSWSGPPRVRRFETSIRQQLTLGCWALVVHPVPLDRQAAVVQLMRSGGLRWCAVGLPSRRL